MKFLETITFMGNDVLIPIDRIKSVNLHGLKGYSIKITSDDGEYEECFADDREKWLLRYEMIKKIIGAK